MNAMLLRLFECFQTSTYFRYSNLGFMVHVTLQSVSCRRCGAEHSSKVNALEEEVDVYANWIDANAKASEAAAE
jgi:transcription elongation factor Elf1